MRIFAVKVCSPEKCHIHWTVVIVLQTRPFRDELPMSNSRFGLKADEDDVAKNEAPNAPDHEERAWKTQTAKTRIPVSAVTLLGLSQYDMS